MPLVLPILFFNKFNDRKKRNKKKRDIQTQKQLQQNSKRRSDDDSPTTTATNPVTKGGTTRKRRIEDNELPLRQDFRIGKQRPSMTKSKKEQKVKKRNLRPR
mmetsp:Transcript_13034/g.17138  ORF Transcript_13034/g.17138 Transcript_13034/m.17138 type:complete len:102 (-) Transcript_13034:126-431(-)